MSSMPRLAVHSAADEPYVPKAVLALRSFQKKHPELSYFLLANAQDLSSNSRRLLDQNSIELIDLKNEMRFERKGTLKDSYPLATYFRFAGPERLADLGYDYSLYIDGDVYCNERIDFPPLLDRIQDFAARPVGTLARTLVHKQEEENLDYDFALDRVCNDLGLAPNSFNSSYEYGFGVIIWNNHAMKSKKLMDQALEVFHRCNGCFQGSQDLFAFVSATGDFSALTLKEELHFCFFEDSMSRDRALWLELLMRHYDRINIVHFVYRKPWDVHRNLTRVECHLINQWRRHARTDFGERAADLFGDLSDLRPGTLVSRLAERARGVAR
jgi:lipopolysaccharide biosynthesis glycosyltransferase